jgi:hypothetical protein
LFHTRPFVIVCRPVGCTNSFAYRIRPDLQGDRITAPHGISGNAKVTLTLVWILARGSNGKCTGKTLLHSEYLTGTGSVSFS